MVMVLDEEEKFVFHRGDDGGSALSRQITLYTNDKKSQYIDRMPKAAAESHIPTRCHARITSFGEVISPTESLMALKPGQSFLVDDKRARSSVVSAAYRLDMKIQTAKEGTRFRIWRLE